MSNIDASGVIVSRKGVIKGVISVGYEEQSRRKNGCSILILMVLFP